MEGVRLPAIRHCSIAFHPFSILGDRAKERFQCIYVTDVSIITKNGRLTESFCRVKIKKNVLIDKEL